MHDPAPAQPQLGPTRCLFCQQPRDAVLFPQRLSPESFSGYAFSARRQRRREHYRIVRCQNCGLVRSDPVLPPGALAELYAESQFISHDEAPFAAQTYMGLVRDLLGTELAQGRLNSVLEVGCSSGFFLEQALAAGISDLLGFEPSHHSCQQAKPAVAPFIVEDIFRPERLGNRRFDLAASFHVFDHLHDPAQVLAEMVGALRPGGHVLLVCHDAEAPSARLLRDFSPIFDVEHIYLFSAQTLGRLLSQAGLEVLKVGALANTYPLGYWLRMAPLAQHLLPWLPARLKQKTLTLKAGNLFALARRQ